MENEKKEKIINLLLLSYCCYLLLLFLYILIVKKEMRITQFEVLKEMKMDSDSDRAHARVLKENAETLWWSSV